MEFEYRVVPAPKRLKKRKGCNSTEELFAVTLTEAINAEAHEGWEYIRAETLAAEEPRGFFRKGAVVEATMLIFRRPRQAVPLLAARAEVEPRTAAPPPERTPERAPEAKAPEAAPAPRMPRGAEPAVRPEPKLAHRPEPRATPQGAEAAPPLLRPVPRFRPGEKS